LTHSDAVKIRADQTASLVRRQHAGANLSNQAHLGALIAIMQDLPHRTMISRLRAHGRAHCGKVISRLQAAWWMLHW